MKLKRTSHPLFRCTKKMRCKIVARVTNRRYKKCARTGCPSGSTKFSFVFACDAGEWMARPRKIGVDADEES